MNSNNQIIANDVTAVRDHLLVVFSGLRDGSMDSKDAFEINNTAGKIISTCKMQLAYHGLQLAYRSAGLDLPDIPFLNPPPTTKTIENKPEQDKIA